MTTYIFENKSEEREYRRLQLVEAANDTTTIGLLEKTGIQAGWHCLELGAGAGSILRWLGNRVGPTGLVVGIDKTLTYLRNLDSPWVQLTQGSFLEVPINQVFDCIHARYVLIHNQQDVDILKKVLSVLKPGGWAVFEEPDFTSAALTEEDKTSSSARVNQAICRMFVQIGLDPAYALRLPRKLQEIGWHLIRTQTLLHLCPGNSPMAKVMGESALVLEREYVNTGLCSPEDIQEYVRLSQDPGHWAIYHSTTSVIVRKPPI